MKNLSPDIFLKMENSQQINIQLNSRPVISEFWKEIIPGLYQNRLTGRKLSKVDFRIYQNHSDCGPLGFLVEVF